MTVWKYDVPVDDRAHDLTIPGPAVFLHAACQVGVNFVQAWFLVAPDEATSTRRLRVFGTGQPLPHPAYDWYHRATVLTADGALVWHLFEHDEAPF